MSAQKMVLISSATAHRLANMAFDWLEMSPRGRYEQAYNRKALLKLETAMRNARNLKLKGKRK